MSKPTKKQADLMKKLEIYFDENEMTKDEAQRVISETLKKTGKSCPDSLRITGTATVPGGQ